MRSSRLVGVVLLVLVPTVVSTASAIAAPAPSPITKGATLVGLRAGQVVRGIDARAVPASGIDGTITQGRSGHPLNDYVWGYLFGPNGMHRRVSPDDSGFYSFRAIPPSKTGYRLCTFTPDPEYAPHFGHCLGTHASWAAGWPPVGRRVATTQGKVTTAKPPAGHRRPRHRHAGYQADAKITTAWTAGGRAARPGSRPPRGVPVIGAANQAMADRQGRGLEAGADAELGQHGLDMATDRGW
jgi:hypothetical protein